MSDKYLVLARKYRPMTFDDLVGQDALVKTVQNSIIANRIPHAYLLTGIRGIGKTTSARIIAKTLNCIGESGKEENIPLKPCGKCTHCNSILNGSDVDVIEIDAASNNSVDNIRELIEAVKYVPMSARFKIYIIDEVHMLSTAAFNALLKTLEEPPEHAKFILATTEVRKIPVTILSRCQRFDLKRLPLDKMAEHLGNIAAKENITITKEALNILAFVSEGSVRDGLSLLDQSIAHAGKEIDENIIRQIIGLADKTNVLELFHELMAGNADNALKIFANLYDNGVEISAVVRDLMEITHLVTRIKIGAGIEELLYSEAFVARIKEDAAGLNMAALTLLWQMLSKGLSEIIYSPFPAKSLEMLLIRICYATGIPDFRELLKKNFKSNEASVISQAGAVPVPDLVPVQRALPSHSNVLGGSEAEKKTLKYDTSNNFQQEIKNNFDIYHLAEKFDPELAYNIHTYLCLVKINKNHLVIADANEKSRMFCSILPKRLKEWTGIEWTAELVNDSSHSAKSIKEIKTTTRNYFNEKVMENEQIKQVFASLECIGISKVEIVHSSDTEPKDEDQKDEDLYNLSLLSEMTENSAVL